jgi:hypothetical protein
MASSVCRYCLLDCDLLRGLKPNLAVCCLCSLFPPACTSCNQSLISESRTSTAHILTTNDRNRHLLISYPTTVQAQKFFRIEDPGPQQLMLYLSDQRLPKIFQKNACQPSMHSRSSSSLHTTKAQAGRPSLTTRFRKPRHDKKAQAEQASKSRCLHSISCSAQFPQRQSTKSSDPA